MLGAVQNFSPVRYAVRSSSPAELSQQQSFHITSVASSSSSPFTSTFTDRYLTPASHHLYTTSSASETLSTPSAFFQAGPDTADIEIDTQEDIVDERSFTDAKLTTPTRTLKSRTHYDDPALQVTQFRLVGACIVERLPRCFPPRTQAEREYDEEIKKQDEAEWKVRTKQYKVKRETSVLEKTFAEMERRFGILKASKNTPEEDADLKNIERRLDHRLYLIVKKNRGEHQWQLPQGGWEEGETMRQCAERELREECGKELSTYTIGNAPSAHYAYALPSPDSQGNDGAKVFFYRMYHLEGKPTLDENELIDYAWVTKKEMNTFLSPELFGALDDVLVDF
eukprot:CAMPEP_0177653356 /NCGR_PEP_ID=MMETSP0447-20121125/13691_1 /TAXON_ID=0 /ORGANISM="Stygamoeba regulata, Strain BSH-02190019" /LENGTH=338 /DNA_ID=CAMNT_0019156805 /DNA_START=76 /DNA_END=1093 /DNA_ORIENTATION=+